MRPARAQPTAIGTIELVFDVLVLLEHESLSKETRNMLRNIFV